MGDNGNFLLLTLLLGLWALSLTVLCRTAPKASLILAAVGYPLRCAFLGSASGYIRTCHCVQFASFPFVLLSFFLDVEQSLIDSISELHKAGKIFRGIRRFLQFITDFRFQAEKEPLLNLIISRRGNEQAGDALELHAKGRSQAFLLHRYFVAVLFEESQNFICNCLLSIRIK